MIALRELELPIYLLIDRKGPRSLPSAVPSSLPIQHKGASRQCILAYRHRTTAAAFIEQGRQHLAPYGVRGAVALDRVAAVALARYQCQWLGLEAAGDGSAVECFIDLKAWLKQRQPWSDDLIAWATKFGFTSYFPF